MIKLTLAQAEEAGYLMNAITRLEAARDNITDQKVRVHIGPPPRVSADDPLRQGMFLDFDVTIAAIRDQVDRNLAKHRDALQALGIELVPE